MATKTAIISYSGQDSYCEVGGGGGVAYSEWPMLHLELTDCDSLAFSYAKNIFGQKGMIISDLLDLCLLLRGGGTKGMTQLINFYRKENSHHI